MTNKCAECGGVEFDIYIEPDKFNRNGHAYTVNVEYSSFIVLTLYVERLRGRSSVLIHNAEALMLRYNAEHCNDLRYCKFQHCYQVIAY